MKLIIAVFALMLFAGLVYPTKSLNTVIAEANLPIVTTAATKGAPISNHGNWFVEQVE